MPGGQSPFPGTTSPRDRDQMQVPRMERPIFLSGKVVLDDGTPPPEPVTIERICNGIARPEGYTDSKGRFSFQLGQNAGVFQDASVSNADGIGPFGGNQGSMGNMGGMGGMRGGISERDLMGCELRASLPGFRSEVVNLAGRRVMDNPDVGTIVLKRLANVEGLTFSATSSFAPKEARKAFDKGRDSIKKKKWADAQKNLEKATQIYPKYAVAWNDLGQVYEQQDELEQARNAYAQALAADSKFVTPYMHLALMSVREQKWDEVADTTDRVLHLNPFDFSVAYFYNAVANLNLGRLDAAERSAREVVKLDSRNRMPKAQHLLGVILAQKRDYRGASEHMKRYLELAPDAPDAESVRAQLGEVDMFLGAQTAVQAEQAQQ